MASYPKVQLTTLTFEPVIQEALTSNDGEAVTTAKRAFLDFVFDGRSFSSAIPHPAFISFLGWLPDEREELSWIDRLLLRAPADLSNGRRSFFVCPECADLKCGSYSAIIERNADTFVWRDIGFVWWNYEREGHEETVELLDGFGPFVFDASQYERALERAQAMSRELRPVL